jgi:hypothetical protein
VVNSEGMEKNTFEVSYQVYRNGKLYDSGQYGTDRGDYPQYHALEIAEDILFEKYFVGNGSYQFVIRFSGGTCNEAVTVNLTISGGGK